MAKTKQAPVADQEDFLEAPLQADNSLTDDGMDRDFEEQTQALPKAHKASSKTSKKQYKEIEIYRSAPSEPWKDGQTLRTVTLSEEVAEINNSHSHNTRKRYQLVD